MAEFLYDGHYDTHMDSAYKDLEEVVMEVTPTPEVVVTPAQEVIVMTNQPDLTFMDQYSPGQYVFTMMFMILMVLITAEAVIFVLQKIFGFAETCMDNADSHKTIFDKVMKK